MEWHWHIDFQWIWRPWRVLKALGRPAGFFSRSHKCLQMFTLPGRDQDIHKFPRANLTGIWGELSVLQQLFSLRPEACMVEGCSCVHQMCAYRTPRREHDSEHSRRLACCGYGAMHCVYMHGASTKKAGLCTPCSVHRPVTPVIAHDRLAGCTQRLA